MVMARDVEITEGRIAITAGEFDTEDGITLKVDGDAHPRIQLTPQGLIAAGDGTFPPIPGGASNLFYAAVAGDGANLADGDFTDIDVYGANGGVATYPRSATVGFTVLAPSGENAGIWTITASGPCTPAQIQPGIGQVVMTGPAGAGLSGGAYLGVMADDAVGFTLYNPQDGEFIRYVPGESGLTAENVQDAITELKTLIDAL